MDENSGRRTADPVWLARTSEEILDPQLPIIDPHHHLYDQPGNLYLFDDLRADVQSGHNVRATVYVQGGSMYRAGGEPAMAPVGEVEFANGVAAMAASGAYGAARLCAGIVGFADLALGEHVAPTLDAEIAAGGGRFRGVRFTTKWDPDEAIRGARRTLPPGFLGDAGFRRGFAALAARGLSFDAWVVHPQLGDVADLARAFPDTPIIVNHCGGLMAAVGVYAARREDSIAQWGASMAALAGCANVAVKLGGLGMPNMGLGLHRRPAPASSEELAALWRPYIEPCIELFGPDRCMFESNFPPDKHGASYAVLWNAFKRLTAGHTPSEKRALFAATAARIYRLPWALYGKPGESALARSAAI